ncbi:calpain 2, (m II) large subunit [Cichlidogyrus casuarinus]|uniref:Calpain 2, (M II) large subunit n=1 Tax=Cichlidogyrus casuarinus TaxID=1844966 RepID=A0ABD2Q7F6_9PLAT
MRAQRENKALVPDSFGDSARKPVPAGRGGNIPKATETFEQIKKTCLANGTLYEDPDFPPNNSSLVYEGQGVSNVKWLRPGEIVSRPEFIIDGASRFDVKQGTLGDCWLLAAVACISMNPNLMSQILPSDQSFSSGYCGAFRFRFWHFGEWREIVVDDRLPTTNGSLIYLHSADRNEFWSALMEKAYAKLNGCYQNLKGGTTSEALEDFTGGISEMFDLRDKTPPNLLDIMLKAQTKNSLMACSIQATDQSSIEAKLPNGLVMGHAYSITSVSTVKVSGNRLPLLRIRNPWGDDVEWRGAWSDSSNEWNSISSQEREQLGLVNSADGEFWMSFSDFCKEFEKVEICHLGAQSLQSAEGEDSGDHHEHQHGACHWEETIHHSEWRARVNAGGCRNYLETFWTNPQFRVIVTDPDDDDGENKGTLIIGLMQKDRRALRKMGMDMLTIGYAIYECPTDNQGVLDLDFFKRNRSIARSPNFINLREVTGRHHVPCGQYVIIPSTFKANEEADFMLRVFSEKPHKHDELDEKTTIVPPKPDIVPSTVSDEQVKKLYEAFTKVAGSDNEIDAEELLGIINAAFSKDMELVGAGEMVKRMDGGAVNAAPSSSGNGASGVGGLISLCCGLLSNAGASGQNQENQQRQHYSTQASGPDSNGTVQRVATNFGFAGFSLETARSLVTMMDVDRSGRLSFDEFRALWELLRLWKTAFKQYDSDKNGTMSSYELRSALNAVGFKIDNNTFASLAMRFSKRDGSVAFDDFVMCCARVRTIFELYAAMANDQGKVNLNESEVCDLFSSAFIISFTLVCQCGIIHLRRHRASNMGPEMTHALFVSLFCFASA